MILQRYDCGFLCLNIFFTMIWLYFWSKPLSTHNTKILIMEERAHRTEVEQIASYADGKVNRAIISLILSSGMQPKKVRELTLDHLLNACAHYFPNEEITLDKLKYKDPTEDNFIACFDIGTEKTPRITCCSPEALFLILHYISSYRIPFESKNDPIFLNLNNKPIHDKYISDELGSLSRFAREHKHPLYDFTNVTANKLIKSFDYVCDTYFDFDYKKDVINLMKGSNSVRNHNFYKEVCEDRYRLIGPYLTIVDCLYLNPDCHTISKFKRINKNYEDIY